MGTNVQARDAADLQRDPSASEPAQSDAPGELITEESREIVHDERSTTVLTIRLYKKDGQYILTYETFKKIDAKSFRLHFQSAKDVFDYISRDTENAELAAKLLREAEKE
jgi:hypothetical protein